MIICIYKVISIYNLIILNGYCNHYAIRKKKLPQKDSLILICYLVLFSVNYIITTIYKYWNIISCSSNNLSLRNRTK